MGEVVFWTMVRIVVLLPLIWVLKSYIGYELWWTISLFSIYGIIIHPAIIHYNRIDEKNKEVIEDTLCSACEHFDESAVICLKHDEHPTKDYIPCDGNDWSPKASQSE
ncbi:MAG: hypothetical protein WB996_09395 [Ignavibacteriaceae bacterium]